jgi:hypothetical protein
MPKLFRIFVAFLCAVLGAAAILGLLLASFLILAMMSVWFHEGHLTEEDMHSLVRGGGALLVTALVLWGTWWLGRRVFGREVFSGSFKQVPSKTGRTERLALSISTVAILAISGLWIYERTRGNEWLRLVEVIGWLVVVFLALHVRVLLHELGHLSAAQLLRMQRWKIQIGTGPLLWWRVSRHGLRWEWRLWPQIGLVFAQKDEVHGFKWRQIVFIAAGPVVDALIIWAGYTLIIRSFGGLFDAFTGNALGVVVVILFWLTTSSAINGLIPHRIHLGLQSLYTDGYWLCRLCLLSDKKAQEFVMRKRWEQFDELARQARMYFEMSGKTLN